MKRAESIETFSAKVTIGHELGYSGESIDRSEIIKHIQKIQDELIQKKNIYLSVSVSDCTIVMSGQIEPHLTLSFINYPKFPLSVNTLKSEIENLTKQLMNKLGQNRTIIEYLDETIMLEQGQEIDPRIRK